MLKYILRFLTGQDYNHWLNDKAENTQILQLIPARIISKIPITMYLNYHHDDYKKNSVVTNVLWK